MKTPNIIKLYAVLDSDGDTYFQVFSEPYGDGGYDPTYDYSYPATNDYCCPATPDEEPKKTVVKVFIKKGEVATILNPVNDEAKRVVRISTLDENLDLTFRVRIEFDLDTIISFTPWND